MTEDNWLGKIKVVIFDMDGTLYQEDTFMERYIRYLLEGTEHEADTEAAISMGKAIRSGEHFFGFGHFYHLKDDLLVVRLEDGLARGYAWDGSSVPMRKKFTNSIRSWTGNCFISAIRGALRPCSAINTSVYHEAGRSF